jgi:hypothetical protein
MGKIVIKGIVDRKPKTGYYLDGKGNIWARPMGRSGGKGKIVVARAIVRKPRTLYYVDGKGNLCEAPMASRARKKKR